MDAITVITEDSASSEASLMALLQSQLRQDSVTLSRKQPPNKQERVHSVPEVLKSLANLMWSGPLDALLGDVVRSLIPPIAPAQAFVRARLLPRGTGAFR